MTSSSDATLWQPFLSGATDGAGSAKVIPMFPTGAPEATALAQGGWLPALRTTAEREALAVREVREQEAYDRGASEAGQAERELADARCATALRAVAGAVAHLEEIAGEFARDRERDLQALAIAVARHVVQHELTIDPLRVGELVKCAIELLPLDQVLEVRLHPEDLRTLTASLERMQPEGRQVKLHWMSDPSVDRGGFLIETPARIVDGRTDVGLRALYESFDHE